MIAADGAFDDPADSKAKETALATVTCHAGDITLSQTVSQASICNRAVTSVTYTYDITNTSDSFSWSGTLTDNQLGFIGAIDGQLTLAPGVNATRTKTTDRKSAV